MNTTPNPSLNLMSKSGAEVMPANHTRKVDAMESLA
jgi:hypothetical protein